MTCPKPQRQKAEGKAAALEAVRCSHPSPTPTVLSLTGSGSGPPHTGPSPPSPPDLRLGGEARSSLPCARPSSTPSLPRQRPRRELGGIRVSSRFSVRTGPPRTARRRSLTQLCTRMARPTSSSAHDDADNEHARHTDPGDKTALCTQRRDRGCLEKQMAASRTGRRAGKVNRKSRTCVKRKSKDTLRGRGRPGTQEPLGKSGTI